jgi:hypothetical protein
MALRSAEGTSVENERIDLRVDSLSFACLRSAMPPDFIRQWERTAENPGGDP